MGELLSLSLDDYILNLNLLAVGITWQAHGSPFPLRCLVAPEQLGSQSRAHRFALPGAAQHRYNQLTKWLIIGVNDSYMVNQLLKDLQPNSLEQSRFSETSIACAAAI